ncbi:Hsp70 family protein [Geomonas oryzae]|uniref:Hsp70 family protein n=1 Tax=Geomonas oryzae TaxID=2364273 RepID=UPI00100AB443|nr:hypothetical protein [Geomonas oryzae]
MSKKEFFINTVQLMDLNEGSYNIPTVLYYKDRSEYLIGSQALAEAQRRNQSHLVNEDFKIDLGNYAPGIQTKSSFRTATGDSKTAAALTADFIYEVVTNISKWLEGNNIDKSSSIMVAEPLSMQGDIVPEGWLANYRQNIRNLLRGKGYDSIDFLPEPFAVFQYYRYGLKHPLIAQKAKQFALVLDFGGGSFDVCVIETTKDGDISQSGKNSRPMAACSQAVGGFFINRAIAEELYSQKVVQKHERADFHKAITAYKDWKKGKTDISTLSKNYRSFIINFNRTVHKIEQAKLTLSKLLSENHSWALDSDIKKISVPIHLPQSPFSESSNVLNVQFTAEDFKNIFIEKIWKAYLRPTIGSALKRSVAELKGAPITVVLLSGGSANIGWLCELITDEFRTELSEADILPLPDFQEVVAKGLAIECARVFYTKSEGDFGTTTYNRLCLVLEADETGHEIPRFKAVLGTEDLDSGINGVLLSSASSMKNHINKSLYWKYRLDHPPRKLLDYYFLRSSFDPSDLENLQNIEAKTLHSPKGLKLDSNLLLRLIIKEDGTTFPRFYYKRGRTDDEGLYLDAKPFYLDMTFAAETNFSDSYVGFDFGTSNSAVSFINNKSVQLYTSRNTDKGWLNINELADTLPYPLSEPLSKFLTNSISKQHMYKHGFEFVEAALAMGAYIAYIEFCVHKGRGSTKLLKSFTQRSAGPLWALLKECLGQLNNSASFSSVYIELVTNHASEVDSALKFYAQFKHDKISSDYDVNSIVTIFANISAKAFSKYKFGYFNNVKKERFGKNNNGNFIVCHGKPPFNEVYAYSGGSTYSQEQAFVIDDVNNVGLLLYPLVFWNYCSKHPDFDYLNGHCFFFDKQNKDNSFSYKSIGHLCTLEFGQNDTDLATVFEDLFCLKTEDIKMEYETFVQLVKQDSSFCV